MSTEDTMQADHLSICQEANRQLRAENSELKRFWFSDVDPAETKYSEEYAARNCIKPKIDHFCGLQGFGALTDVCPACDANKGSL